MDEVSMRKFATFTLVVIATACSKSPQDQQTDKIRTQAHEQAEAITRHADQQAKPLEQQAEALRAEAKKTGGYGGKRLEIQADASSKQAKLLHEQADEQADAVKEAADAQIKAIRSR